MHRNGIPMIDALIQFISIFCCWLFECYWNTYLSYRNGVNRIFFLWFYTKYLTWFSKYVIELIVALSLTNATKPNNLLPTTPPTSVTCGATFYKSEILSWCNEPSLFNISMPTTAIFIFNKTFLPFSKREKKMHNKPIQRPKHRYCNSWFCD